MTPRALAYTLLQKAEKNDQFLNIALDHALSDSNMSEQDKALAANIVYGVTERRITLDYQIDKLSSRPSAELDTGVLCALRIGLYQLIFLDRIPPHAAINETVSLVGRKVSGFVNAVLRAYTRSSGLSLPNKESAPLLYLSVAHSVCLPLVSKLVSIYGEEKTESILEAFSKTPPTTLSVNTLRISRDELSLRIADSAPTQISPDGLLVKGAVRALYGFDEGLFFVQDEASQICVHALGAMPDETVIDVCSCPGSKSFGAAIGMKNRGRIYAFDLHAKKLPLITSGAKRLGINIITAATKDGREFIPELEACADRVLCDVPCSGFGVLAKKPELRYKDPAVSSSLPDIQLAILNNACRYVKRGGTLVYSTCTIFPEENEENVKRFLATHPEFSLEPIRVGDLYAQKGYITLLPDEYPTDGFFIARMTRS